MHKRVQRFQFATIELPSVSVSLCSSPTPGCAAQVLGGLDVQGFYDAVLNDLSITRDGVQQHITDEL
jgi:hypothetical protein